MTIVMRLTALALFALALAGCGGGGDDGGKVTLHGTVTDTENIVGNSCSPVTVMVRSDNVPAGQARVNWHARTQAAGLPACHGTWRITVAPASKAYQVSVSDPLSGGIKGQIVVQPQDAGKSLGIVVGPGL